MNQQRYRTSRVWLVFICVLALVYGCLDESNQVAEGGIEGTGRSIGPISGFGSVYVNGVRLDTTGTRFIFEGQPGSESQLSQGMVINATSEEPGSAATIEFRFNLIGANDACVAGSLEAVGQQILLDELTVVRNISVSSPNCGEVVAVSGFRQTDGSIVATYLEKLDSGSGLIGTAVVEGLVSALDKQALSFRIGKQSVDYIAAQLNGFSGGTIENGLSVRVVGREETGRLVAASVENLKGVIVDSTIKSIDLSGLVTETRADGFVLGGTFISTTPATVVKNGTRPEIVLNARLLARTVRNDEGALVAEEIILAKPSDISVEAPVQVVDLAQGTVALAGLTVFVDGSTLLLDNSSAQQIDFSLNDVSIGDRLIVFGTEQGNRIILASRLERISLGSAVESATIQGRAGFPVNDPVFSMAGLQIDTTGLREPTGFFEGDVIPITRSDYFGVLQPGERIKVTGLPLSGFLSATRVTLLNFGYLQVLDPTGSQVGVTVNDIAAVWDGTLNTQADIVNGTLHENMTIQSAGGIPFEGLRWTLHDVHVFGPGSYIFETCLNDGSSNCQFPQPLGFTVGPGQLGAHMLMDWGGQRNIDIAVVWDINVQSPSRNLPGFGPSPDPNLVSVDGDGDGIPGSAMVDGPFKGLSWSISLDISSLAH